MMFIDNLSKKVWVYFVREKSMWSPYSRYGKSRLKNILVKVLNVLGLTTNVSTCKSKFTYYYKKERIERNFIVIKTP